jgi:glycerol uptake facilitator-like aquaporin
VTIARSLSDTFAGIAPAGVVAFIAAQLVGMLAAVAVGAWLWPKAAKDQKILCGGNEGNGSWKSRD